MKYRSLKIFIHMKTYTSKTPGRDSRQKYQPEIQPQKEKRLFTNPLFSKTKYVVRNPGFKKNTTVQTALHDFEKTARSIGFVKIFIDPEIRIWFPKEGTIDKVATPSRLVRFTVNAIYPQTIAELEQLKIYQEHGIIDALFRLSTLIERGLFEKKDGQQVLALLKYKRFPARSSIPFQPALPCGLVVWNDDGTLNLSIVLVPPHHVFRIDSGLLVNNTDIFDEH